MNYLLGDLQGCAGMLDRMLETLGFSPSRDHLYVLGDMVNRGPDALGTLQRLRTLGSSATCLLGNHDLHLLAVAHGVRPAGRGDTLDSVLQAPDRDAWVDWLRHRPLALHAHGWLMVHAGVPPQWSVHDALACAIEVQTHLRSDDLHDFLQVMYGNEPARWCHSLTGHERLRFSVNALTRTRFITADGALELSAKEGAAQAPEGCVPWFDAPGRRTAGHPVAFGHWSTLGVVARTDLLALDGGCVWGGELVAARLTGPAHTSTPELIRLPCPQAQKPAL